MPAKKTSAKKTTTKKTIPKSFIERVQRWNSASTKLSKEAVAIRKEATKRGINLSFQGGKQK